MASFRSSFLAAVTIACAGCFDVSDSQTEPVLIDDFDDGDVLPADRHFDQWSCGRYNQPEPLRDCLCGYDPLSYHSSPYSMVWAATIVETGPDKHAGAHLYTQAIAPEDVSRHREFVFSARYDAGTLALPKTAPLRVELYCSSGGVKLDQDVQDWQSSGEWQTFALQLSKFRDVWGRLEGELTACLEQVTSIHFSVNGDLLQGGQGSYVLHIDDVYFQ